MSTLGSNDPTILEEVSIDYDENKVATYDDYCDETYAIKSSDDYIYKTCHDYDYPFSENYSFNVETIFSVQVFYDTLTIPNEKNFAYEEISKFSTLVEHEKNALGAGYIVEFIHDATENYYEGGIYACRNCNNIKFPLYVLKILKLCLFYLPMQVDSCPTSCLLTKSLCIGSGLDLNVLVIFFMMLPLCFNSYLLCEHHCHHHA